LLSLHEVHPHYFNAIFTDNDCRFSSHCESELTCVEGKCADPSFYDDGGEGDDDDEYDDEYDEEDDEEDDEPGVQAAFGWTKKLNPKYRAAKFAGKSVLKEAAKWGIRQDSVQRRLEGWGIPAGDAVDKYDELEGKAKTWATPHVNTVTKWGTPHFNAGTKWGGGAVKTVDSWGIPVTGAANGVEAGVNAGLAEGTKAFNKAAPVVSNGVGEVRKALCFWC
jgi:hypothetical protein